MEDLAIDIRNGFVITRKLDGEYRAVNISNISRVDVWEYDDGSDKLAYELTYYDTSFGDHYCLGIFKDLDSANNILLGIVEGEIGIRQKHALPNFENPLIHAKRRK